MSIYVWYRRWWVTLTHYCGRGELLFQLSDMSVDSLDVMPIGDHCEWPPFRVLKTVRWLEESLIVTYQYTLVSSSGVSIWEMSISFEWNMLKQNSSMRQLLSKKLVWPFIFSKMILIDEMMGTFDGSMILSATLKRLMDNDYPFLGWVSTRKQLLGSLDISDVCILRVLPKTPLTKLWRFIMLVRLWISPS